MRGPLSFRRPDRARVSVARVLYAPAVTPRLLFLPLAAALVACAEPTPSAPPPLDDPEAPIIEDGYDLSDVELGRVDGRPVPDGSALILQDLAVSCLPGPDPSLDNEDPAAQAHERWALSLTTFGWASVTNGVRVFVWDGGTQEGSDVHRLMYSAPVSMGQVPSGQSDEPYGFDRWELEIPVLAEPTAAQAVQGTVLPCSADGVLVAALHDLMVCATDARDLETVLCWFCGDHLGEPSAPAPDTVGRVSSAPGPGGASFTVTDPVSCTYGAGEGANRGP